MVMSLTELSPETCVLCISEALVWGGAHSLDTLLGSAQPGQCTPNPHFNKGRLAWLLHLCHQGACVTPRRKGLRWPVGGPGVVGALLHAARRCRRGDWSTREHRWPHVSSRRCPFHLTMVSLTRLSSGIRCKAPAGKTTAGSGPPGGCVSCASGPGWPWLPQVLTDAPVLSVVGRGATGKNAPGHTNIQLMPLHRVCLFKRHRSVNTGFLNI